MFSTFRRLSETVQSLTVQVTRGRATLDRYLEGVEAEGPLRERVDALELSRHMWQAEMEALVAKAKGQYQAAHNAEERAKTNSRARTDDFAYEGDDEGEEAILTAYRAIGVLQDGDDEGSEVDGVSDMPEGMEIFPRKAAALRSKFGVR